MSIFKPVFGDIIEADVFQLVTDGQVEGNRVEFKREMYGNSDSDKKEFLKDLSSFANSAGGHLVIGIDEVQGAAASVTPIVGDSDATLQRLEQISRSAIEPRIVGVQMRAVPVTAGGYVYIVRVPRSWNPPHRVSYQGTNRFYLRSSAGAHEASVEELRAIFANGADMRERMNSYIKGRVEKIASGEGVVPLAEGEGREGKLIIHVMPFAAFAGDVQIDVGNAHELSDLFQLLLSNGNPRINFDGFMVVANGNLAVSYTQLFRNGIVEATRVRVTTQYYENVWRIPMRSFMEAIYRCVPKYINAIQALGVSPPFVVSIAVLEVQGSILGIGNNNFEEEEMRMIDRPNLILPAQVIADTGTDAEYRHALRPALNALFNAVGIPSAEDFLRNFDANGAWSGI